MAHRVVLILDYKQKSYTFYDPSLWTRDHVRNFLPHVLHVKGFSKGDRTNRTLWYQKESYHFPLQGFESEGTALLEGSCVLTSLFVALTCVAVGVNAPESMAVVIFELANRSPQRLEYGIRRFTEMMVESEVTYKGGGRYFAPGEVRVPLGPNSSPVTRNLARSGFPEAEARLARSGFPEAGWQWLERALENKRASMTTTRGMEERQQISSSS